MTFDSESIKYSTKPVIIVKIEFDEGTEYLSNHETTISVSSILTQVESRIVSFGSLTRSISDIYGGFEISDVTTVLSNVDNKYSSYDLEALFNVDVTITIGFLGDDYADHKTIFGGSVYEFEFTGNNLSLSVKDHVSKKIDINYGHYIDAEDWPNSAADIVGLRMPIIYGDIYGADSVKIESIIDLYGEYLDVYVQNPKSASDGSGSTLVIYNKYGETDVCVKACFYGNPVTFSNELIVNTDNYFDHDIVYDPTNDKFFVAYVKSDEKLYGRTITLSGSTISQSGETLIQDVYSNVINLIYDTTNNLVICSFAYYFEDPYELLVHGGVTGGPFIYGETITGGSSGCTATFFKNYSGTVYMYNVSTYFYGGETVTGNTSGASIIVSYTDDAYGLSDLFMVSVDLSSGITVNNDQLCTDLYVDVSGYQVVYDPDNDMIFFSYYVFSIGLRVGICRVNGADIDILDYDTSLSDVVGATIASVWGIAYDTSADHIAAFTNVGMIAFYYDSDTDSILSVLDEPTSFDITYSAIANKNPLIYDPYTDAYYFAYNLISGSDRWAHVVGARFQNGEINFNASTPKIFNYYDSAAPLSVTLDNDRLCIISFNDEVSDSSRIYYINQFSYANMYIPYPDINSAKCYCIDIVNNIWLVAGHEVYAINNVYTTDKENNQNSPKVRTENITKITNYSFAGGLDSMIAIVQFTADPPTPTDDVFADVSGMMDNSSNVITNPISALEHFLTEYLNFTSSDYDTTVFGAQETVAENEGWLIGVVIEPENSNTTKELIESWSFSIGAVVGFNFEGKLIIKIMG